MAKINLRVVSTLLTIAMYLAVRTQHFLLAGAFCVANGLLLLLAKPPHRNRVAGVATLALGLWLIAKVLGLLVAHVLG
jgi:hypothetical protein